MPPGNNHVERRLGADQTRQTLRAATARQDADQYFRQTYLRPGQCDPVMARHGDFQTAAKRIAMDGGDDRLLTGVEHIVNALTQRQPGTIRSKGADVGAGDEAAPRADQHHGLDRRIGVAARDALLDALGHARPERIHRRIVHGDDADVALAFQADG